MGKEGIENFQRIFGKVEKIPTLITQTIRGGFHIYVKYHERIAKSMLNFKTMKIDILSNGRSVYEGKNYWLVNDSHELSQGEIFFDYIEKYQKEQKEIRELNRKNVLSTINDSVMHTIDDNLGSDYYENYNDWIQVIMALNNCGYSCETAMEFSRKSSHYVSDDWIIDKWETLSENGEIGIGTILHFLKKSVDDKTYKHLCNLLKKRKIEDDGQPLITPERWDVEFCIKKCRRQFELETERTQNIKELCEYMNDYLAFVDDPECLLFRYDKNDVCMVKKNMSNYIPIDVINTCKFSNSRKNYRSIEFCVNPDDINPNNYNLYQRPPTNFDCSEELETIAPLFCKLMFLVGDKTKEG